MAKNPLAKWSVPELMGMPILQKGFLDGGLHLGCRLDAYGIR